MVRKIRFESVLWCSVNVYSSIIPPPLIFCFRLFHVFVQEAFPCPAIKIYVKTKVFISPSYARDESASFITSWSDFGFAEIFLSAALVSVLLDLRFPSYFPFTIISLLFNPMSEFTVSVFIFSPLKIIFVDFGVLQLVRFFSFNHFLFPLKSWNIENRFRMCYDDVVLWRKFDGLRH